MGSELKIEVTEKERHFRASKKSEIRGIAQREVSCCSCGNVLSKKSGRIQSHPIFGIFQCEYCKKFLQKASFKSRKGDSVKLCYICGRDNKETYGCKKDDCPYVFCKSCIKRITPNSLPAAKSGGWECFACNTQPLWMLRGACANVTSDLSKRTKENVVESRNVSSDSEDSSPQTSDLKNISYVKRTRVEETKRLGKRLKAVCDEESPVQQEEKPRSAYDRQNKRGKIDDATKRGVKHVSDDKSSRSHRKLSSSSEDSSLEEIVIPKSKTVVKSQSEREKRMSKNARSSETRKSRNSESHDRRKPIIVDSSSDDDSDAQSDLENSRSYRKSKHKDDNLSKKRKVHRTTRESSVNESKSSNSRSKSSHNEKMPSTRQSKSHRKNRQSESSDDSSSSDSETETVKGSKSSSFSKAKSDGASKMAKRRKGKECSDDEPAISRIKTKAELKSSSSRSSNISSKSSKTKSKHPDSNEEVEEEEEAESRKKAKKSTVKSPGPKSFKEGKIPRRERSSDEDEGRATRSSKNKEKKKSVPSRRDSEVGGFAKSISRRLSKTDKQTSDSSSGKEFNKSKVLRSSFVVLRPIQDLQEDHTMSPNEDPEIDDTSEIVSKDQTFGLKNSVNHFYSEMKTAATKLLNDIEKARKNYSMKDSMRVEEVNQMVLETKRLAERVRNVVDKGDTKVTEYYDKWCTKTKIKNVLKKQSTTPKSKSTSEPAEESSKKSVSVEETREKSPETKILNGANNVESECGSEKIVSDAESSMSIDNSSLSPPDKNASQKKVHVPIESSNREASTLKKSDKPALSSDNEISDNEAKIQSPTMSQFSGLSDVEESTKLQEKTVLSPTSEAQIESTEDDEIPPGDSDNEQAKKSNDKTEKSDVASSESSKTRKIQREPRVVSDSDIEDSALAVKTPPRLQTEQSNSEADPLETSADIFEDSDNNEEISDSEKKLRPKQTKKKDADAVMEEPENSQHDLDKDALDNESENPQESLDKDALNNESENPQESLDIDALNNESENPQESLDKDALNNESENPQEILDEDAVNNESKIPPEKDPLAVEKEHSEVESIASSDIASAVTEVMNYSPSKLSDDTEEVAAKSPKEETEDEDEEEEVEDKEKKKKQKKEKEKEKEAVDEEEEEEEKDKEKKKKQKKEKEKEKEAVDEEEEEEKNKEKKKKQKKEKQKKKEAVEEEEEDKEKKKKRKKEKEKKAVEDEDKEAVEDEEEEEKDKAENKEKEKETEEEEEDEEAAASVAKQPKKVDSTRNSDSDQPSSVETVLNDEIMNDGKSSGANESSDEILESENARAKEALLMSSNSDDSSCDERESAVQSTPNDGNDAPPTPPESDSKSDKNSVDHSPEIESTEKIRKKRSKFRINENRHFMADEKLQQKCVVKVERLKEKKLRKYSRALRKSRDYVESKKIQRLVALDKLEKDQKKSSIDCSENEDETSSKDLKPKKKTRSTKEKEETLLDHLNKVKNGETISEVSSQSDSESSKRGNKEKDKNKGEDRLLTEANRMAKKRLLESSDSNAEEQPASDAKEEEASKKTKKVIKKEKLEKKSDEDEEKKEEESGKNRWRKSKILTLKISDSDSDAEKQKFNASQEKLKKKNKEGSQSESDEESAKKKKKKQTRVRRRVLHSDSDVVISSKESDSDSSVQSDKKKKKKKKKKGESSSEEEKDKKKTRKRTRRTRRSSDSSSSLDERPKATRRKRIKKTGSESDSDDQDGSPGKSGRKNIRKVLRDKQVAEDTKQAAKEEEERLKRIAERQKLYNEMYEVRLAGEEKVDKLVLDFDEETKEPLVSVHEGLVKRLKPHQAQGIKFMWDACFESLERIKSTKGSGCILAHCMGLGKSFQVVTLAHTLLTHEETAIKTVLVVCPLSTVLNWANEFKIWLADIDNGDDIEVYEMTKMKKNFERKFQLARWQETGGVMIIGYEMFRNLTQQTGKKVRKNILETFLKCLVDPGPDLIVCDEGHLLKNEDTALSKAMRRVKTLRRVVLTGTPLQNNLIEYHCMVQFVKPNLLGTKKEFMNRFENPITNGQFDDSTEYDVKLMKKRAHILHKLLEGSVQRFDYSVLTPFLPPKQEYVIFVKLTKIQLDMYQHYLDNYARRHRGVGGSLFADFQALQRIWTHPMVMQMNAEKVEKANEKKRLDATDSEGSLRDFIDDGSDTPCTSNSSDDASDHEKKKTKSKRATRANPVVEEPVEEVAAAPEEASTTDETQWWAQYVKEEDYEDIRCSSKLMILFRIIKESEQIGDKILVFSQSLYSLSLIERFLELIDEETQKGAEPETLDGLSGSWALGLDYFRLDGQTSADNRRRWCDIFNKPSNTRARLFLISTRAGGLGINLTAANRVVIFDASWNPSHDVQSIFRIYRFGQKKPCYVYRLLAAGTMEEKIYNRQVTKLSLSCRVVDEQQIERHYSNNALAELYKLELPSETETTLALPKDRLLAEIFLKYKQSVENYHEHDSLLENQAGEELDEEERQQAWLEYEEEKKGKRVMAQQPFINYQDAYLMQQINAMNMASQQNTLNNPAMLSDYQNLQRLMEKDYPGIPEAQQKIMASQAVYEMYNYVEKQAMANHRGAAGGGMQLPNLGGLQGMYNNQVAQSVNPRQTYMDVLRMQQQLAQQQQNGQVKFANSQQQLRADILRQQQQQQLLFAQQAQLMGQSSTTAAITIDDDDIMEVPSVPETNLVPPAQASEANPKNKEE